MKITKKNLKTILCLKFPKEIEGILSQVSHLILRVGAALFIMTHGVPKFLNFSRIVESGRFPDPLGVGIHMSLSLAVLAEFIAALFLLFGLFTRLASVVLVIAFFVIVFIVDAGESFQERELAVMYLLSFTYFMLAGSRQWSLDHLLRKKL